MVGPSADPPSSVGQMLGGYELLGVLGEGGMGTVFLARHPRLPRNVALKVLHPALSRDPQFRARFEREAALAASLDHPNIVAVHDRGLDDDRLWISMQYAGRTNAADVLAAGGPMDPARAVHIVSKVGAALDHAHRVRLLHRDVKPANVMLAPDDDLDESERVLLTDFGIAKADDSSVKLTETGAMLATFAYAAPEQIEGRPLDHRVDIYALGAVLFELLTARQPYVGDSPYALMVAHLEAPPPDPRDLRPDLPAGFGDVIAAAMAKDREQRPDSGRALGRAAGRALLRTPIARRRRPRAPVPALNPPGTAPSEQPFEVPQRIKTPVAPIRDRKETAAAPTSVTNRTPATPTNIVPPIGPVADTYPTVPERGATYRPAGFNGPPSDNRTDQHAVAVDGRARRRRLISAALALLLAVAGAGFWLLLNQPPAALESPSALRAQSASTGISLTWERVAGADRYEVLRDDDVQVTTPGLRFLDKSGAGGERYEYRVRALGSDGAVSPASAPARVYAPLAAPENLRATSADGAVMLSWDPVPNARSYRITRIGDNGPPAESDRPEFVDSAAPSGTHVYRVSGLGDSSAIPAVSAMTSVTHAAWGALEPLVQAFAGIVSDRPGAVSDYGATCSPGTGPAGTAYYDQYVVCTYPNGIRQDVLHYPDAGALAAARAQLLPGSLGETGWYYTDGDPNVFEGPLLVSVDGAPVAWRWIGYNNLADRLLSAIYVEWPGHTSQELYDAWWLPIPIG